MKVKTTTPLEIENIIKAADYDKISTFLEEESLGIFATDYKLLNRTMFHVLFSDKQQDPNSKAVFSTIFYLIKNKIDTKDLTEKLHLNIDMGAIVNEEKMGDVLFRTPNEKLRDLLSQKLHIVAKAMEIVEDGKSNSQPAFSPITTVSKPVVAKQPVVIPESFKSRTATHPQQIKLKIDVSGFNNLPRAKKIELLAYELLLNMAITIDHHVNITERSKDAVDFICERILQQIEVIQLGEDTLDVIRKSINQQTDLIIGQTFKCINAGFLNNILGVDAFQARDFETLDLANHFFNDAINSKNNLNDFIPAINKALMILKKKSPEFKPLPYNKLAKREDELKELISPRIDIGDDTFDIKSIYTRLGIKAS